MRAHTFTDPEEGWQLPLLVSELFPAEFRHGFTARGGGVSAPPFESLNLGGKWGDARDNVLENRRRVARAAGASAGELRTVTQVHGAVVSFADSAPAEADALCAVEPGVAVAVFVADCIPALIADPRTGAFAAVHAGWRGTVAGVLPAAVRALAARYGARPADLRIALGPAIGACCFEVGPEVVAAIEASIPGARDAGAIIDAGAGGGAKPHVDLKRANVALLRAAGVSAGAIDVAQHCTSCDRARFYSFRRDGARTGQHVAFITRRTTS